MNILESNPEELQVIEPEIIGIKGRPPKPDFKQKVKNRLAASLALGLTGMVLCGVGLIFSLSLIGLIIGLPLIAAGMGLILASLFVFISGGKVHTVKIHFPSSDPPSFN